MRSSTKPSKSAAVLLRTADLDTDGFTVRHSVATKNPADSSHTCMLEHATTPSVASTCWHRARMACAAAGGAACNKMRAASIRTGHATAAVVNAASIHTLAITSTSQLLSSKRRTNTPAAEAANALSACARRALVGSPRRSPNSRLKEGAEDVGGGGSGGGGGDGVLVVADEIKGTEVG